MVRENNGAWYTGVVRLLSSKYPGDVDWEGNGKFKALGKSKYHVFDRFGELIGINFGEDENVDKFGRDFKAYSHYKEYHTLYGFNFSIGSVIYGNSNHNIFAMGKRHFAKKKTDEHEKSIIDKYQLNVTDFDLWLRKNNESWFTLNSRSYGSWVRSLCPHEYAYNFQEACFLLSQEPHIKKELRKKAYYEIDNASSFYKDIFIDKVEWKMKGMEMAKCSNKEMKVPRVIVDCKVENSLVRVHFANSWKKAHSDIVMSNFYCECEFNSSPEPTKIAKLFDSIQSSTKPVTINFFSDDSIITFIDLNGIKTIFNVDIASNDSSHSIHSFKALAEASNMDERQIVNLLRLVKTNIFVQNSTKTKKAWFSCNEGYLPSGLGDTSVSNNNIYMVMCYALNKYCLENDEYPNKELFQLVGLLIGFRFTFQEVKYFEEMQFLKHSPIIIKNKTYALPNLGMLLKYSGKCKGNIPEINYPDFIYDFRSKCCFYQSLLTYGFFKLFRYKPWMVLCPYFDYLSRNDYSKDISKLSKFDYQDDDWYIELTMEQAYARYRHLSINDIVEFEELLHGLCFGVTISCDLVDKVIESDYGYTW